MVFCRLPLRLLVFFLVSLASLPLLASCFYFCVVLLRMRGFCVLEFVNSAQQQLVCYLMSFFLCILSSSQDKMHCTLSLTVCTCTPCQRASFNSTTDSFSWGHDPYTLTCKARPSFDSCGTSLSVSLSLSLSLSLLCSACCRFASALALVLHPAVSSPATSSRHHGSSCCHSKHEVVRKTFRDFVKPKNMHDRGKPCAQNLRHRWFDLGMHDLCCQDDQVSVGKNDIHPNTVSVPSLLTLSPTALPDTSTQLLAPPSTSASFLPPPPSPPAELEFCGDRHH